MWLSYNMLSTMVDLSGISPEDLADKLTMATAETEGVEYMNKHLGTIITAKIESVEKHPNADKLTLCNVYTGAETLRIVCGAKNHKAGDIVPLATIGTVFTEEFVIKKSKIRGEESNGMLCSEKELGFAEESDGIMILPQETKVGVPLSELFKEWVDIRIEIDNKSITHRPDLWSHHGFAREIGALYNRPVKDPVDYSLKEAFKTKDNLSVTIKNPEEAPRYSGLVIKNIKIGESPEWLKAAVTSIGMRPISNIVDITNYVMAEIGEPMHAFDRKKLRGNEIIVRMAQKNEKMTTLDGQEHTLFESDIVIADEGGAVALAGVMGGGNSEIEDDTSEIVLEAANFNPINIRKTAQRIGLRTEAAARFEKSLSPLLTEAAIIRCYDLIKQIIPEAEATTKIVDAYPKKIKEISLTTTTDFIRTRLGEPLTDERIIEILTSLNFDVTVNGSKLDITVPHYRATKDISVPEDIVEEIGRIHGYDNIPPSSPLVPCEPPEKNKFRLFERQVKQILSLQHAMFEVSNYSFVGDDLLNKIGINEDKEVRLKNTLSQEQDRLRRSLVPHLLENIVTNQKYNETFRIYELGRVYIKEARKSKDLSKEVTMAAGAVYVKKSETPLFFESKRIISGLLQELRIKKKHISLSPVTAHDMDLPPYIHPGRAMNIFVNDIFVGYIFELHPQTKETFEIISEVALFDINISLLFECEKAPIEFKDLHKFPEVPFECSVLADKDIFAEDIRALIAGADKQYIDSVDVIAIYEGDPIPEGKKSISFKTVFYDEAKTLEPGQVETLQNKVIKALEKGGYQLR